jgi:general secretion pathway protein A
MYLEHFHLKKEPFGIVPDPEFMWLGHRQTQVLETLRAAVSDRDGCLVLTGDIGTGKTILVKRLVAQKGLAPVFITVTGPELTGLDVYRLLAEEFHMNGRFESQEEFIAGFSRVLLQAADAGRKAIIVIDEAQRLTPDALQDITALAGLQSDGKKLLKILLVGQLEFNADEAFRMKGGVASAIAARCRLEPLAEAETQRYIEHRLQLAGRAQPLFSPEAVREIHALSKGVPRLINFICDHALLYGYSANLEMIDRGVIRDCSCDLSVALDLDDEPAEPTVAPTLEAPTAGSPAAATESSPRQWRSWIYLAAAMAAAGTAFYLVSR